jgi:Putative Flp pilus-assembly TadE/G-like
MNDPIPRRRGEHGQALVLLALSLVALLAMTGLVIDGGNAWAQQRQTQNASDAAAEAGTVVLAEWWATATAPSTSYTGTCPTTTSNPWDSAVCQAVYGAGTYNNVTVTTAYYTNADGSQNLGTVGQGSLPTGAQGVRVVSSKNFGTTFARVVGINQLSTGAQATAVVGQVSIPCAPGQICGTLPVTFPVSTSTCAGNGTLIVGTNPWTISDSPWPADHESIVPLCKNGPGSVGWLSWPCESQNGTPGLLDEITNPCALNITLPAWIDTSTGNPNAQSIEDALNAYHGKLVWLPQFTSSQGNGNNLQYWVTQFQAFHFDAAYIAGNNNNVCNSLPGQPFPGGNGSNGCLKGWWTSATATGTVKIGTITQSATSTFGVQLIK